MQSSGLANSVGEAPSHSGLAEWWNRLTSDEARAYRVVFLLLGIAAMSVGDLILTLTYATSIGMVELNPLARLLMQHATTSYIVTFKLLSVSIACGLLFFTRRARVCELATWAAFFGLFWLTMRWVQYNDAMQHITSDVHLLVNSEPRNWVEIRPE